VVEDEMLIGMLLEDMLAEMGHEVVAVVPRVNEALATVQQEAFDVAILDVHLGGQSAFPVAEALIDRGIPFVFATGYGERGLPEKYRGRPILQKPFAKDDLERILKSLTL
jgi:CheY-like chemotaxis protein